MKPCTLLWLSGLLFFLVSCGQEGNKSDGIADSHVPLRFQTDGFYQAAAETVLQSGIAADEFEKSVTTFINQPDQANLKVCREAWLQLHKLFLGLDYFFYDALRSQELHALVFNIHAWPLAPGFIDSLPEYPVSGIINDLTLKLSKATLRGQQALTSSEEIILGLHAAEYLLWQRPPADFQAVSELSEQQVKDGLLLPEVINNRRRRVLDLISEILDEDLRSLGSLLVTDQAGSREHPINDPLSAIKKALDTAGSELMLLNSVDHQAHSEFSQSSLQNIHFRLEIIQNSLLNTTNLTTLLPAMDQQLADEIHQTLASAFSEINYLQANNSNDLVRLLATINLLSRHVGEAERVFAKRSQ